MLGMEPQGHSFCFVAEFTCLLASSSCAPRIWEPWCQASRKAFHSRATLGKLLDS